MDNEDEPSEEQNEGAPCKTTTAFDLMRQAAGKREPPTSMFHGGTMSGYMELKMAKLREQYEAQQGATNTGSADMQIFKGVSLLVNGLTRPNAGELKALMLAHGGRFENYLVRGHVTHVIAANLPDTKIKQMANERDPIPIVRPEWVVDSLAQGRLLPIEPYRLVPVKGSVKGQQKLTSFSLFGVGGANPPSPLAPPALASSLAGEDPPLPANVGDVIPRRLLLKVSSYEVGVVAQGSTIEQAQRTAARLRAQSEVLTMPAKNSSETSPEEFVGTFFKASRLHFIGSWKKRIEELLSSGDLVVGPSAGSGTRDKKIIHLDMDCFFAQAITSQYPELQGRPLVVSHSTSDKGTGEVSSQPRCYHAILQDRSTGLGLQPFITKTWSGCCPKLNLLVPLLHCVGCFIEWRRKSSSATTIAYFQATTSNTIW